MSSDHGGTKDALEELAKVFDKEAAADDLLDQVDFPRSHRPPWTKPIHFWNQVHRDIEKGLVQGGLERLLAAASRLYPGTGRVVRRRVAPCHAGRARTARIESERTSALWPRSRRSC